MSNRSSGRLIRQIQWCKAVGGLSWREVPSIRAWSERSRRSVSINHQTPAIHQQLSGQGGNNSWRQPVTSSP